MIKGLYEAHLPVSDMHRSIDFYRKLDLELAYQSERVVFFWLEKGKSWLGLWKTNQVEIPYHPSIRHVALQIDIGDMPSAKDWLKNRGIDIRPFFNFTEGQQPLVLDNNPQAHAAIYFDDPDGNVLELIAPLRLDFEGSFGEMSLEDWYKRFPI
ncbi:VOC family protein [Peribacillus simplex]|uniref:VOC family protein n=1 Tax=Peribacillus simplex TaxID=1478 RepID=UPI000F642902|nr:VOC family protein [Peribacillus simplex]RRN69279.1 VOC family protein [Peribacillus simplex]